MHGAFRPSFFALLFLSPGNFAIGLFLYLVNSDCDYNDIRKVVSLYNSFSRDPLRYKYYQYNVTMGRYEFISGHVKRYGRMSIDRGDPHYYGIVATSRYK